MNLSELIDSLVAIREGYGDVVVLQSMDGSWDNMLREPNIPYAGKVVMGKYGLEEFYDFDSEEYFGKEVFDAVIWDASV